MYLSLTKMAMRARMQTSSLYMADMTVSLSGCAGGLGCAEQKLCSHKTAWAN